MWCGIEEIQRRNITEKKRLQRWAFKMKYFFHVMAAGMDTENLFSH